MGGKHTPSLKYFPAVFLSSEKRCMKIKQNKCGNLLTFWRLRTSVHIQVSESGVEFSLDASVPAAGKGASSTLCYQGLIFQLRPKAYFCFLTAFPGNDFLALLVGWTNSSSSSDSTSLDGDRSIVSCRNGSSDYSSSCPDLHWEAFFFPKVRARMLGCRYFLS